MFLLAVLGLTSFSQYDDVKTNYLLQRYDDAKTALDKALANPKLKDKDKPEGLYWNFLIDVSFFIDSALAVKHPESDSAALLAFNQYIEKDPDAKLLKDEKDGEKGHHGLSNLKLVDFNYGVRAFRDSKWKDAYNFISRTNRINDIRQRYGFVDQNFLDTNVVLFAGYSAQNSGDLATAAKYYEKLIDRKAKIESRDFESSIYYYLLGYLGQVNDQANFKKYADISRELYPQYSDAIGKLEMRSSVSNASLTDLLTKFKGQLATGMTEEQFATYADAFSQPDKDEVAKLDSATQVQVKLAAAAAYSGAFSVAIAHNVAPPADGSQDLTGVYAYDASIIYTNLYQDLDNRFYNLKGADATLKPKRDAAEKLESQYGDSVIVWTTNTYNYYKGKANLTKREISFTKTALTNLTVVYGWKRDRNQGVNVPNYEKYDALYKQFDAETDKYDAMLKQPAKTN